MLEYVMSEMVPVVSELDFILHPFSEFMTVESEKVMPETMLLDFPPTEPIDRP